MSRGRPRYAHACAHTRPGHGAEACRTAGRAGAGLRHGARGGRQAQAEARGRHRRAGEQGARGRREGRPAAGGERAGVSGTVAATRPALAATRPGQGPRYGHCARLGVPVRAWVCSAGPGLGFGAL